MFFESKIWQTGEDNLETFYIYGLLSANETIFAFSEGRIRRRDKDPHHIVLKRSFDGGKTWGKNQVLIESRNGECFCNPTPIFERKTGKIFLFYAQNFENNHSELFLISTNDNGETWSESQKLTSLFENNLHNWTLHLSGPGHGIQLSNGRLILQIWHRREISFPVEERNYGVSFIYSDDFGENWQNGGTIPIGIEKLNESRIVELANGELLLNARSGAFSTSPRYLSKSFDKGLNWTKPEEIKSLSPAFATDSGFINFTQNGKDLLVFTRPSDEVLRKNLTVYLSEDEGKSWKHSKMIYEGFAGYSDVVLLPNLSFGMIYGRDLIDANSDVEGNVKTTVFANFTLDWLNE